MAVAAVDLLSCSRPCGAPLLLLAACLPAAVLMMIRSAKVAVGESSLLELQAIKGVRLSLFWVVFYPSLRPDGSMVHSRPADACPFSLWLVCGPLGQNHAVSAHSRGSKIRDTPSPGSVATLSYATVWRTRLLIDHALFCRPGCIG